jgi:hypothetical protein
MLFISTLNETIVKIKTTFLRFPVVLLFSCLCFVLFMLEQQGGINGIKITNEKYRLIKTLLESTSGIALYFAIDIFSEQHQISKNTRIGYYLLSFCILGLHYYSTPGEVAFFDAFLIYRYILFIVCFHLLVSFAAFFKEKDLYPFWQYNQFIFIRLLTAVFFSFTLFAGIGSCFLATEKLFSIQMPHHIYANLAAFIFFTFNTFYFLYGIPSSINVFRNTDEFKKSIRVFVQYILFPIILLYAIILYAYTIKIIFVGVLPNGWVCMPILIFSILGMLAYLLIYPIRNNKEFVIIFYFSKMFFYILLPLLMLYFIGIYYRIKPYGITEERYLVMLIGIWLTLIAMYIIFSKKDNIIIIPTSLFLLLGLSIIGPWSMFNISAQSQLLRFKKLVQKDNGFVNGKLNNESINKFSANEKSNISSIIQYLFVNNNIKLIEPLLADEDLIKLKKLLKNNKDVYTIQSLLGFTEESKLGLNKNTIVFLTKQTWLQAAPIQVNNQSKFIQIDVMNTLLVDSINTTNDTTNYNGKIKKDSLVVYLKNRIQMEVNTKSYFSELLSKYISKDTATPTSLIETKLKDITPSFTTVQLPNDSMIFNTVYKTQPITFYFTNIELNYIDSVFNVAHLSAYIVY